jgi:hypothetical protein
MPYIHEDWQIEHLEAALRALTYPIREIMFIRTRGGSKTQDTMKLCLYLIYLGFEGLYFTANASQLERPKIYMKQLISSSFLKYCVEDQRKMQVEFQGSGMLTLENLTESKALSPRADFIVFDEERKADPDAYNNTLGIFSNTEMLFTIHISTPEKASIFEDNYDALKQRELEYDVPLVFERELEDVSFLWDDPARRARYLEIMKKAPQWFIDQEFHCKFVLPAGAVFQNIEYGKYPDWLMAQIQNQWLCSGVDWNPVSGHWLVAGKWTPDFKNFVFTECHAIGKGYAVDMNIEQFNAIAQHGAMGNHITMEKSGLNEEYIHWFRKLMDKTGFGWQDQNYHYEEWDSQGIEKLRIITFIIQNGITLWCDKTREDLRILAKMIGDCRWDPESPTPKLVKNPAKSPHALDGGLHAMSKKNRSISVIEVSRFY